MKRSTFLLRLAMENKVALVSEDLDITSTLTDSESDFTCLILLFPKFNTNQHYSRKPSARERPTLCPFCYNDITTHFTRHLLRHHKENSEVQMITNLKPGSKERSTLIQVLRKRGYFNLHVEKNILNPVRKSKNPSTEYFICTFCLGHYSKKLLHKHVKRCPNKLIDRNNPGRNCLTESQTFMAGVLYKNSEFFQSSRLRKEGESLLNRHKRQQIRKMVFNKIREMARLLLALKNFGAYKGLLDVLRPENFSKLIYATKIISGYEEDTKNFKPASLVLHMGTNLKLICNVAFKLILEKKKIHNISWVDREARKNEIKDLIQLIESHWCNEVSSLALKTLNEKRITNRIELPLTSDILLFQAYLDDIAEKSYQNLISKTEVTKNYKILMECVLAKTVIFNRKRIGDVQYLQVNSYTKDNSNMNNHEEFSSSLTAVEQILSKKFKRIIIDGKHSKPVPILFSKKFKIRKAYSIVPPSNPYLFANPNSVNSWMSGVHVLRRLAKESQAEKPHLLTSTKFRKHIATTLQLMDMQPDEMEQVAKFIRKKLMKNFTGKLPQDIYQTSKVAKVLLLLEKGRGREFKGKNLTDIRLEREVYYSSEDETIQGEHDDAADETLEGLNDSVPEVESNNNQISTFELKNIRIELTDVLKIQNSLTENDIIRTQRREEPDNDTPNEIPKLNKLKVHKKNYQNYGAF
ncbi:hypothetical protein ABEB36_004591 [Hypothenemus hampei]|uniref:Uncharacterized protein n=1 Tax=Hypothenemus hampei TaxID=57062 RepID=A0ABD1F3U9_HYPHA